MQNVLLVQPNYQGAQTKNKDIDNIVGVHPPLGLLYLAAALQREGFTVKIIDANFNRDTPEEVAKAACNFEVVGVSVLSQGHNFALKLAQGLPGGIIKICGGAQATACADVMLKNGFDIAVRGEGEQALVSICKGCPRKSIPGISWNCENNIIHNEESQPLDVNKIPFPSRELLAYGGTRFPYASAGTKEFPWAPILTSRGCPFNCYYCNKTIHGLGFRARAAEDVVSEMVGLVERYGVKEFDVVDDVFNLDIDRAIKICDLIIKSGIKISLRFGNGIRADRIVPELARKLRQAGTSYVAFGLESGCQRVLNSIPKQIKLDDIKKGVSSIQKEGIHTSGLFMLGLLEDTEESMQDTINFAKELRLDIAYFSIATPYPGTRFYKIVKEKGRILFDTWENFNHSYGKMLYEYPGAPSPEIVQAMFRRAFRDFYLRPGYLFRQLLKKKNKAEFKILRRGAKELLRNLFIRGR